MTFPFKRNKFGVAPKAQRTVGTRTYASKAEMTHAKKLAADPTITEVVEQPRVPLGEDTVYKPDFLVIRLLAGEAFYVDVKGMETPEFKRNKKLWKRYGRLPLHIVKNGKVVEIVEREEE
jgi:predicted nuclease of restriction endonuclease-like RecB superfamily